MTRRWIIGAEGGRCRNAGCPQYGKRAGKPEVDPETGAIKVVCKLCRQPSERQANSWKERRPCRACNYVRDVTVSQWHSGGERARDYCDACDLMNSVGVHRQTADRLEAKAMAIRAKRKAKS